MEWFRKRAKLERNSDNMEEWFKGAETQTHGHDSWGFNTVAQSGTLQLLSLTSNFVIIKAQCEEKTTAETLKCWI